MENGTRIPEFVVGNFRNGSYKFVGDKTDLLQNGTGSVYHEIRLLHQPDIRWPGGSSTVPVSNPVCGFTGKDCYQEEEDAGEKQLIFFIHCVQCRKNISTISLKQQHLTFLSFFFFITKKNNIYVSVQRVVCCSHQSDRLGYVSRTNQTAALGYVSRTNQSVVSVLWFERCSNFNEAMGDSERAVHLLE